MLVGNYDYAGTQKFRLHILRDEESDVTLCGIDTLKRKGNWEWTQSEGDKDCGCAHCNRKAAQQNAHLTSGGLCAKCGSPSWAHGAIGHEFIPPHPQVA